MFDYCCRTKKPDLESKGEVKLLALLLGVLLTSALSAPPWKVGRMNFITKNRIQKGLSMGVISGFY